MQDAEGNDVLVTEATLPAVLRLLAERSHGMGLLLQFTPTGCVNQGAWLCQAEIDHIIYSASNMDGLEAVREVVRQIT